MQASQFDVRVGNLGIKWPDPDRLDGNGSTFVGGARYRPRQLGPRVGQPLDVRVLVTSTDEHGRLTSAINPRRNKTDRWSYEAGIVAVPGGPGWLLESGGDSLLVLLRDAPDGSRDEIGSTSASAWMLSNWSTTY
jgi:hypothetical protein